MSKNVEVKENDSFKWFVKKKKTICLLLPLVILQSPS